MSALPRIARVPHTAKVPDACPYCDGGKAHPVFADVSRIVVNSKHNATTETAAFIIPGVGNNKLRHETLQRFMLINDSVTVAIEVPIWLTEEDITALEAEHRIQLVPSSGAAQRAIADED